MPRVSDKVKRKQAKVAREAIDYTVYLACTDKRGLHYEEAWYEAERKRTWFHHSRLEYFWRQLKAHRKGKVPLPGLYALRHLLKDAGCEEAQLWVESEKGGKDRLRYWHVYDPKPTILLEPWDVPELRDEFATVMMAPRVPDPTPPPPVLQITYIPVMHNGEPLVLKRRPNGRASWLGKEDPVYLDEASFHAHVEEIRHRPDMPDGLRRRVLEEWESAAYLEMRAALPNWMRKKGVTRALPAPPPALNKPQLALPPPVLALPPPDKV